MPLNRSTGALVLSLAMLGGLGSVVAINATGSDVDSAADRRALAANMRGGAEGSAAPGYDRLVDMLPNAKDPGGGTVADSVVLGSVVSATDEAGYDTTGYQPGTAGRAGARVTLFDDPLAEWRTLRVRLAVEETLAGPAADQLELSWHVMGNSATGEDAAAVGRALKELGRIVVLSEAYPSGPEWLGIKRGLPDGQFGIAVVAADGKLSFPFAEGSDVTFMNGVDTVAELRAEARKPARTVTPN